MPLNPSGAISLGGTTAGQSIALELGGPGTAQIALNDANVRTLAGVPSGAIIMPTNFYGKSNRVTVNLTISGNTYNYDVYANRGPSYIAGSTDLTVTVNPGVLVGSTSTGAFAMLVPSAFSPTDTVTIVNNGTIIGRGGNGGNGGNGTAPTNPDTRPGGSGGTGGSAISVSRPTTITNNGVVASGGGGGGGGAGTNTTPTIVFSSPPSRRGGGGGGGGAGFDGGSGGTGGAPQYGPTAGAVFPGGTGSSSSGGSGGSPGTPAGAGGSGGGQGASGSGGTPSANGSGGGGGGTGNYITGNPFVTWPVTGTRLGNVA